MILIIIIFMLSAPFSFLFHKNMAYYCYKEVVYRTIINNIVGSEKDPEQISLKMLEYFNVKLFAPHGVTVIDKDVYNDLFRGIAWCDQRAWAMGTFLGKLGIDNRMIMTRNPEGRSNHTVLGVFIDGRLRFFDPYYGIAIKKDNELVSYEDICREPSLFYLSQDMLALKEVDPLKYEETKDYYTKNIFYDNPYAPSIWSNPISKKDFKRKVITAIMDCYIYVFGHRFSHLYQDVYLMSYAPPGEAESIYFKARNYDLLDRYQLAIDSYKEVINKFPQGSDTDNALFFLGVLYSRNKKFELSVDMLQILLKQYPNTTWKRITNYYLGLDHELMKNYSLAEDYYWKTIEAYKTLNEPGLRSGELKTAKRLSYLVNMKDRNK